MLEKVLEKNDFLKIYIPEVIPKYKNINNYAYKNIFNDHILIASNGKFNAFNYIVFNIYK